MTKRLLTLMSAMILVISGFAVAGDWSIQNTDKGDKEMVLDGGTLGNVPFTHRQHQKDLKNECRICHEQFPQKKGTINAMKSEGTLGSKDVMKTCTKCHRAARREGSKTAPIKCRECHSH